MPDMSIGELAARTGLSVHTLRFYEREGLMVYPVRRRPAAAAGSTPRKTPAGSRCA